VNLKDRNRQYKDECTFRAYKLVPRKEEKDHRESIGKTADKTPKIRFSLFTNKGSFLEFGFADKVAAKAQAWGPDFRPKPIIRMYRLLSRAEEPREKEGEE